MTAEPSRQSEESPVTCMECGRPYVGGEEWTALGPEWATLEESLVYCPDCWKDDE